MPAAILPSLVLAVVGQVSTGEAPRNPTLAPPAQVQPQDPLAGKPVQDRRAGPSLVERDFQGNIRRPESTAVEAAVAKLNLDDAEREKVEKVLRDRALVLDKFVEENLDLLTRFGNAEHSTSGKEKLLLAVEAFQKLAPLRAHGPLDKQVEAVLSTEHAAQFARLLREYWNALAEEDSHAPKPKGRIGVIAGTKLEDLGHEIEAAFHRAERSGGVLFGYLFKSMTLSEEQTKRLRELCALYSASGLDDKDKSAQGTFFLSVTQILDAQQRKEFVKRVQGKK